MNLSEDYWVFELHQAGERRLLRELELRRRIDERIAEAATAAAAVAAAEAGDGVSDGASPRRGIRRLLPRRLRPPAPSRSAIGSGAA